MVVIRLDNLRERRRQEIAQAQMAALAYLQDEIGQSGFDVAARLLGLAILAIEDELKKPPEE